MNKTHETQNGGLITLWDTETGIGLQFHKGDNLSRYTSSIVIRDPSILETEEGVAKVSEVSSSLMEQAEAIYPLEFKPLITD